MTRRFALKSNRPNRSTGDEYENAQRGWTKEDVLQNRDRQRGWCNGKWTASTRKGVEQHTR